MLKRVIAAIAVAGFSLGLAACNFPGTDEANKWEELCRKHPNDAACKEWAEKYGNA